MYQHKNIGCGFLWLRTKAAGSLPAVCKALNVQLPVSVDEEKTGSIKFSNTKLLYDEK